MWITRRIRKRESILTHSSGGQENGGINGTRSRGRWRSWRLKADVLASKTPPHFTQNRNDLDHINPQDIAKLF